MFNKSGIAEQIISLPKGGGAVKAIDEKFQPDLHTGTGNLSIPIAVPSGRNGLQPQLSLNYSTSNGNGPFGLGWNLTLPGICRKTSRRVPRYLDENQDYESRDIFILSGTEDLVPAEAAGERTIYRPRTEEVFDRIIHHCNPEDRNNYWEVRSKDGLVSYYGTQGMAGADPAVIADPTRPGHVFAWKITRTVDPFGNHIEYSYFRDSAEDGPHHWDQLYIARIRYVDYIDEENKEKFLVSITFEYDDRPDAFSDYRSGFEIRTRHCCKKVVVRTHADRERIVRSYGLSYHQNPHNGFLLLKSILVQGYGDDNLPVSEMPPLELGYTRFQPENRDLWPVTGEGLPSKSLANPGMELVDLMGNGLPDILEMNGTVRYWRNLGNGKFDLPRLIKEAPPLQLSEAGVQIIDANGDGRADLLVSANKLSGYFPMRFGALWDHRSFRPYKSPPSFNLKDPRVKLVDLDGDGVTDAVHSGTRMEHYFNDPERGWYSVRSVERQAIGEFPDVDFSDSRVKWGDITGDGLQDIILIHNGRVEYWPNLGHGNWGKRILTRNSPRLPYGYDPKRILIGDVDGDGLADMVYVDDSKVTLWINQSGSRWSDPYTIPGTPRVSDMDAVRLVDLLGSGVAGILWSADATVPSRHHLFFLDLTGGTKPNLLNEVANNMGATTRIQYSPSTEFYLKDEAKPETRWKTPLPFPVHVVNRVEVLDEFSKGKLTTAYNYHHGYWDGLEREFRGFGRVDQYDSETFEEYTQPGLHSQAPRCSQFSPPILTKTWFHPGPVEKPEGGWAGPDYSSEFWAEDPPMLNEEKETTDLLDSLGSGARRDALRSWQGTIIRTETYALDGTSLQDRPYTVLEYVYGLRKITVSSACDVKQPGIFFPYFHAQRSTLWDRGNDPMTRFSFAEDYDEFGQARKKTLIACPRGWHGLEDIPGKPYLAIRTRTEFARPLNTDTYIMDRAARTTTYEIKNDGNYRVPDLKDLPDNSSFLDITGQNVNYYDGDSTMPDKGAFQGLPFGQIDKYGALVRTAALVLTDDILQRAFGQEQPPYITQNNPVVWPGHYPDEFRRQLPPNAGYSVQEIESPGKIAQGYFRVTERRQYDFHTDPGSQGRGLLVTRRDSLGNDTFISYDAPYALFPVRVKDTLGMKTEVAYDYRALQPREVIDPNRNNTRYYFSPLGLLRETWVKGNPDRNEGDRERPSLKFKYDFMAYVNSPAENRQPAFIHTSRQVHHDTETNVDLPKRNETIEAREYLDGFGRTIQTRALGEEIRFGDAVFGGNVLPAGRNNNRYETPGEIKCTLNSDFSRPNVVVSGWQLYDNKGRVVRKYEPFFAAGWDYTGWLERGQKIITFYNPLGQVTRTVYPDGSEQRVVYGVPGRINSPDLKNPAIFDPTPWEAYTYDANDNAVRTHGADPQSEQYDHHWNTPASITVDALGRTVLAAARNRARATAGKPQNPVEECRTQYVYDIRGNLITIIDALNRETFQCVYDLLQQPLQVRSIDAGMRRTVADAAGNVIEERDGKGALILNSYDQLHRFTRRWERDGAGGQLTLRELMVYGDAPNSGLTTEQAIADNLLGVPYQHYDEAGRLTFLKYDFKGNLLEKVRQVLRKDLILKVIDVADPSQTFQVDWQSPAGAPADLAGRSAMLLDETCYETSTTYDALDRIKTFMYPRDVENARKTLQISYNRAGALEQLAVNGIIHVDHIAYNARGQRILIALGNNIMTRYAYDEHTFRLKRLRSERCDKPAGPELTYRMKDFAGPLQDFIYEYDLKGNILSISDYTPGCGVINNPEAMGSPDLMAAGNAFTRHFEYDPLYRLLTATGREWKTSPSPRPWGYAGYNSDNHGTPDQDNAPQLTAIYKEEYEYDPAGNMVTLKHRQNGGSWVRHFGMGNHTPQQWGREWPTHFNTGQPWGNIPSNRLTHVGDNDLIVPQTHIYDDCGNLIQETSSRYFEWDHSNRLKAFSIKSQGGPATLQTRYMYDSGGQRVMKLVRKGPDKHEVTVYIDGVFEHCLWEKAGIPGGENNYLHVMDNQSRIAILRAGSPFPGDGAPESLVKYHLGDHLGSSRLVVDETGDWINREEFFPYGETSFGSFAKKRYRYTGKECDEESGLYYHGARYFAPWLGRWISVDPVFSQFSSGISGYVFVSNNPIMLIDPDGKADVSPMSPIDPKTARPVERPPGAGNFPPPLNGRPPAEAKPFVAPKSPLSAWERFERKVTIVAGASVGLPRSWVMKSLGDEVPTEQLVDDAPQVLLVLLGAAAKAGAMYGAVSKEATAFLNAHKASQASINRAVGRNNEQMMRFMFNNAHPNFNGVPDVQRTLKNGAGKTVPGPGTKGASRPDTMLPAEAGQMSPLEHKAYFTGDQIPDPAAVASGRDSAQMKKLWKNLEKGPWWGTEDDLTRVVKGEGTGVTTGFPTFKPPTDKM